MNNPIAKPQLAKNGLIVFSDQQGAPTQTADNPGPQNGTYVMQQDGSGLKLLFQHCTAPSLALSGQWLEAQRQRAGAGALSSQALPNARSLRTVYGALNEMALAYAVLHARAHRAFDSQTRRTSPNRTCVHTALRSRS